MSNALTVELNPAQCDIYDSLEGLDYIYQIGGRYSGKTYGILQIMVLIGLMYPGYRWVIFRKVYASIKDSVYAELKGVIHDMNLPGCRILKSPLHIELPGGSEFLFKGMDSVDKTKGLANCHGAFLEELNEFNEMDFETIDNGIRGKGFPNYFFMAHNPVPIMPGMLYWFQKMFGRSIERGKLEIEDTETHGKVARLKTSFLDNKYCPEKRRKRLLGYKDTNPDLYKLWALGDYAELKGVVFSGIDIVDSVPSGLDDPGYGLDFGFSSDPAALVRVWHNSTDIWVEGLIYSTSLTNSELYDTIISKGVERFDDIVADSAEPKSIQDLQNMGLANISGVKKKPNYKVEVVQIMKGYNIHLIDGDIDLKREFTMYSWQQDKDGRQIPKLQDGNDHYVDAVIMYCHEKLFETNSVLY